MARQLFAAEEGFLPCYLHLGEDPAQNCSDSPSRLAVDKVTAAGTSPLKPQSSAKLFPAFGGEGCCTLLCFSGAHLQLHKWQALLLLLCGGKKKTKLQVFLVSATPCSFNGLLRFKQGWGEMLDQSKSKLVTAHTACLSCPRSCPGKRTRTARKSPVMEIRLLSRILTKMGKPSLNLKLAKLLLLLRAELLTTANQARLGNLEKSRWCLLVYVILLATKRQGVPHTKPEPSWNHGRMYMHTIFYERYTHAYTFLRSTRCHMMVFFREKPLFTYRAVHN